MVSSISGVGGKIWPIVCFGKKKVIICFGKEGDQVTATFVHLHIVCGCFLASAAELGSYNPGWTAHKAQQMYQVATYRDSMLTPILVD